MRETWYTHTSIIFFLLEYSCNYYLGGVLLVTEGNLEMQNENKTGMDIAFGDGGPGQSWLARATFGLFPFALDQTPR